MNLPGDPPRRDHGRPNDHGVEPDDRGQDQPTDKNRAQQTSGDKSSGDKSQGDKAQCDAGSDRPPSPGQPAGGE